jgi:carbonic anhydrase
MKPRSIISPLIVLIVVSFSAFGQHASATCDLSPKEALEKLLEGNKRFTGAEREYPNQKAQHRKSTAKEGQKPFVSILSCSDSRVPIEHVFDVGIGEIFVVRVAGNVADKIEIGSLEYGTGHLGTPLLVVMGHTKCGAVTAVVTKSAVGGNVVSIVKDIQPAVDKAKADYPSLPEDELIPKAIKANVWKAVEDILKNSEEIRKLVKDGKLKVVGALYDIETGVVTNLGVHAKQEQILASMKNEEE